MDRITWITRPAIYAAFFFGLLVAFVVGAVLAIRYNNTLWLPAAVGAVFGVLHTLLTMLIYRRVDGQLVNRHTLQPLAHRSFQFWFNLVSFLLWGVFLSLYLFTHTPTPTSWQERLFALFMAYFFCFSGINAYTYARR